MQQLFYTSYAHDTNKHNRCPIKPLRSGLMKLRPKAPKESQNDVDTRLCLRSKNLGEMVRYGDTFEKAQLIGVP